jgi:hypothetical protein
MKNLLFIILTMFSLHIYSQNITQAIYSISMRDNPLFSKSDRKLELALVKNYKLGENDTTYFINLQIKNLSIDPVGGSAGWSQGLGIGIGLNYAFNQNNNFLNIYSEQFKDIHQCISDAFIYINKDKLIFKEKVTANCTNGILTFGVEFIPGNTPSYYLRLGESFYYLNEQDFKTVMTLMSRSRQYLLK